MSDIQTRILKNKIKQGFGIDSLPNELAKFNEEVNELWNAIANQDIDNIAEELADVVIMCYGIAIVTKLDLDIEIAKKLKIIENRRYELGADGQLHKVVY